MKKIILILIVILIIIAPTYADRLFYTEELVERADVIAVWFADDLIKEENQIKLGRPRILLKGTTEDISKNRQYSSRLKRAIQEILEHSPYILFLRKAEPGAVDLIGDGAALAFNRITHKVVENIIAQLQLQKEWKNLSIKEQVERSDLIVEGVIQESEEYPKQYFLNSYMIYRGIPPKDNLEVLPVSEGIINKESIFFIQKYYGSGPNFIVMDAVSLKDAAEYQKYFKK